MPLLVFSIDSFRVKYQLDGWQEGYQETAYDDTAWMEAPDAGKLIVGREMGHVVWFRRHFTYHPAEGIHAPLQIIPGRADERLLIYVNGKQITFQHCRICGMDGQILRACLKNAFRECASLWDED